MGLVRFTRFVRGIGGKRKAGVANSTEVRYGEELELRRLAGEVEWYKFEAFKVRLADGTFYTSDYAVMMADGELQIHEVKAGRIDQSGKLQMLTEDASKIKIKVAADMYPFRFMWAVERPKKAGRGFELISV